MKIIQCNVYGNIEISDLALKFIDTSEFQRLHDIKQTGGCYKVFPTANHSRFEHSIGVYHLSGVWFDRLLPDSNPIHKSYKELIKLAGLLHDIGHGPFSHTFDHLFAEKILLNNDRWCEHENRSVDIILHIIQKYKINLSPEQVNIIIDCICPKKKHDEWFYQIICNKKCGIDSDKLDYIFRDNKAFGLPLNIDSMRIITNSRVINNQICFSSKIEDDLFDLFYVRYRLYKDIYCHPKVVAFELIIQDLLFWIFEQSKKYNEENEHNPLYNFSIRKSFGVHIDDFCKLTDQYILQFPNFFTKEGYEKGRELSQRFITRNVYKTCNQTDDNIAKTIDIEVGFNGKKRNPFEGIFLYDNKKNNMYEYKLKHINIENFNKKITYHYKLPTTIY